MAQGKYPGPFLFFTVSQFTVYFLNAYRKPPNYLLFRSVAHKERCCKSVRGNEPLDNNRELKISKNFKQELLSAFYSM